MFEKIVIVEPIFINTERVSELEKFCKNLVVFDTDSSGSAETLERIGDADCILVAKNTEIDKDILAKCKNLKFIQLCCSYFGPQYCKVDIPYATSKGIGFGYLFEYGDNGVIEYTISSIINLMQGACGKKWNSEIHELSAIKVGILGLGSLGKKNAKAFSFFGSKVYYFSKTRKMQLENENLTYLPLDNLLKTVDVLVINLNRDVCLIGGDKLKLFGNNKVIVNTSMGTCYEISSLKKWLEHDNNFYVCDEASIGQDLDLTHLKNVVYLDHICGVTKETLERATDQIVESIKQNCER